MPIPDEDVRAAADFAEMTRIAARDHQVTGEKVSLYQAHAGRLALVGAALMLAVTGIFVFAMLPYGTTWALAAASLYGIAAVVLIGLSFQVKHRLHIPLVIGLALYIFLIGPPILLGVNLLFYQAMPLLGLIEGLRASFQHQRFAALRKFDDLRNDP